jgi:hypothetical protein
LHNGGVWLSHSIIASFDLSCRDTIVDDPLSSSRPVTNKTFSTSLCRGNLQNRDDILKKQVDQQNYAEWQNLDWFFDTRKPIQWNNPIPQIEIFGSSTYHQIRHQ